MARQFKGIAADFIKAMKTQFIGRGADPNDIFVQDLFKYNPPANSGGVGRLTQLAKGNVLDEYAALTQEDRHILSTLLAVYNENIQTKRDILTQARNLFETSDIVQTVIDVMIDDGFNSFQNEKEEFKIEYTLDKEDLDNLGEEYQQQIQNIIDDFVDKFALKSKVAEIVPDLLRDGEYAFGVLFDEKGEKGVTEIVDDLDVINLIPFYENNKLSFVINQNNFNTDNNSGNGPLIAAYSSNEKPVAYKADNIVFFRLNGPTKKRINMSCFYNSEFKKLFLEKTGIKLPKYIRMALPIYYNAMKNLNRLKIMDNVATVLDLNDILKPEVVHVTVPTNTSPKEAQEIIRNYERQLNDVSDFATSGDALDLSTLAAQANRRKVLPQWMDTKGSLNSAGINQSAKGQNAWDSADKIRNLIALNIGIPPFYINVTGTPTDKAQIIKWYSRYTRKLTSLQKTLADGVKDFIMIHMEHRGLRINRENITVKFKAITSGDSLDDTDLLVGLVTGIGDLYKALDEITASEHNNLELDDEQFKQLFDDWTGKYLNIANLIKVNKNKFDNIEGEESEGQFEPIGSPSPRDRSHSEVPDMSIGGPIGGEEDNSYADFVADSNDLGLQGTEPAIEEI